MKTRIITAIVLVLILFPIIAYGGWPFRFLELFVVIVGGIEMMSLSKRHKQWPRLIMPLSILAVIGAYLLSVYRPQLLLAFLTAVILVFISLPVFSEHFTSNDSFLCLSYVMLFFFTLHSLEQVLSHPLYIWLILVSTYGCDTGAYFGGRFLGRHKMNERVSPKKTGGCLRLDQRFCAVGGDRQAAAVRAAAGRSAHLLADLPADAAERTIRRPRFQRDEALSSDQGLRSSAAGAWRHPRPTGFPCV